MALNFYLGQPTVLRDKTKRLVLGYTLLSASILAATAGGSWDISNHLLNKPETFFALPHGVLYVGVSAALAGAVLSYSSQKGMKKSVALKVAVGGVLSLVIAGPVDFMWHSAFGLDGLMSPPHMVLVLGMVASSVGALGGVVGLKRRSVWHVTLGMLPVWLSLTGFVYLLTLPFSKTNYFDFNPNPDAAVIIASVMLPFLISAVLCTASMLTRRRFGTVSAVGSAFMFVGMLTSILPNSSLTPTIPFYLLNILPIIAADALLWLFKSKYAVFAAGMILATSFLTLYYPLVTHTYNKAVMPERLVWPSLTAPIYFDMLPKLIPLVAAPAATSGFLGTLVAIRIASKVL